MLKRRELLQYSATSFALFAAGRGRGVKALASNNPMANLRNIGPLLPPDENGMRLPAGFKSRIVARSGIAPTPSSDYLWHSAPDGGAVYRADDDGWIYVSNSERSEGRGGVGALKFDAQGEIIDSYSILTGTSTNCAGGKTPWQTWLSCEEIDEGQVYECDPHGKKTAEVRPALGTFKHEAVAVDPIEQTLYLTEDKPDGGFYRFRPTHRLPELSEGTLEIARINRYRGRYYLSWKSLPDPQAKQSPTRTQVTDSAKFKGGEGIVYQNGKVFFSTKGDNRVWCYHVASNEITILYDFATTHNPILSGVDNLEITASGEVLVAEDLGNMQIIVLTPDNQVLPLLQIDGHERSEITGPAFDLNHERLYFSSQRGSGASSETGITYEVSHV